MLGNRNSHTLLFGRLFDNMCQILNVHTINMASSLLRISPLDVVGRVCKDACKKDFYRSMIYNSKELGGRTSKCLSVGELVNSVVVHPWRGLLCSLEKTEIDPGLIAELKLKGQNSACRIHASTAVCVCVLGRGYLRTCKNFQQILYWGGIL